MPTTSPADPWTCRPSSLDQLAAAVPTVTDEAATSEASRDWWPLAMHWALAGEVPRRAAAVCRPTTVEQVAEVVRICAAARVPLTVAGGRSGVCGASVPVVRRDRRRPHRARPASSPSTSSRAWSRCWPARSVRTSRPIWPGTV